MTGQDWAFSGIVVGLLTIATVVGQVVKRQPHLGLHAAAIESFNGRVRAWWIICSLLAVAFLNYGLTVLLFGFLRSRRHAWATTARCSGCFSSSRHCSTC